MTRSSISTILIVLTASAAPLCAQAGAAGPVHFGIIGGGGVYNERAHADSFDYTASATHYGFNGGAGMNFRLGRFSTFVESRYQLRDSRLAHRRSVVRSTFSFDRTNMSVR